MESLARFFVENRKFTLVLSFALILFGFSGLMRLTSESYPSVDIGTVVVTTYYKGATASDIETKITKPLENEIRTVRGIKKVLSTSQAGISRIVTTVDIDRYVVAEVIPDLQRAVDRARGLPNDLDMRPEFLEIKSDEFPVIEVAVVGSNKDRLRDRVADLLREEIADNKKVSNVLLTGFRERQFKIYLDRQRLEKNHVAINEVMAALIARNVTIPGGEIKTATEQRLLRIEGKAMSKAELEDIVVRANYSGEGVTIRDIARVEDAAEDATSLTRYNGGEATLITITKKGGVDLISMSREIRELVTNFQSKYEGQLSFHVFNDEGLRVGNRISILSSNAVIGLGLVIFFLLLFLPGLVGIVTALSLPLALMATIGIIPAMGYTINTITILALIIAVGMLVDNSIVVSENFVRLREEGVETREAINRTIVELWVPVTATLLTTIAAFLPMLVTSGILGQFIKAMPIVVSLSLGISLLESFFLLPARLDMIGPWVGKKSGREPKQSWYNRFLLPLFISFMDKTLRYRYLTALVFGAIIAGSFVLMTQFNKFILFPAEQTEVYVARIEMPEGTTIERTDQTTGEIMDRIRTQLGEQLAHAIAKTGTAEVDPTDPKGRSGPNVALIILFVTEQTKNEVPTQEMLDRLRLITHPDTKALSFEAVINGPPIGDPVNATIRANNLEQLDAVVEALTTKLQSVEGVFDVKVDDVMGDEEVHIQVDHEKLARLGLSLQDIGATIRVAIAGQKISDVNINNREVDYVLRLEGPDRETMQQLGNLQIADRQGNLIPLGQIASFVPKQGEPHIKRFDYRRAKTVTANLNDSIITSVAANTIIEKEFLELQKTYRDVTLTFGGEGENTQESFASLLQALLLSIVGIFALLVLIFRSYLSPFIILSTIPLGLVGMSLAFYVHQRPVSFLAIIGIIGLGGIIVNSGIVLISFIEQMKKEGQKTMHEILVEASSIRLRAVIVTALTTVSGLFPTAYGIGGADEFIIPICLALAWGLTSGTILTIIWVPCAYGILEDMKRLFHREPQDVRSTRKEESIPDSNQARGNV
jgi:multidrug efflux pump subunit AcrB